MPGKPQYAGFPHDRAPSWPESESPVRRPTAASKPFGPRKAAGGRDAASRAHADDRAPAPCRRAEGQAEGAVIRQVAEAVRANPGNAGHLVSIALSQHPNLAHRLVLESIKRCPTAASKILAAARISRSIGARLVVSTVFALACEKLLVGEAGAQSADPSVPETAGGAAPVQFAALLAGINAALAMTSGRAEAAEGETAAVADTPDSPSEAFVPQPRSVMPATAAAAPLAVAEGAEAPFVLHTPTGETPSASEAERSATAAPAPAPAKPAAAPVLSASTLAEPVDEPGDGTPVEPPRLDGDALPRAARAPDDSGQASGDPAPEAAAANAAGDHDLLALWTRIVEEKQALGPTGGNDWLSGDGGNDFLQGLAGNDHLFGGGGNDRLDGGAGADRLYGGQGGDLLIGGGGGDYLSGAQGDDWLFGNAGRDRLSGGSGHDVLFGGSGADDLYGGAGDDILLGGEDADRLAGGAGDDQYRIAAGDGRDDGAVDVIADDEGENFLLLEDFPDDAAVWARETESGDLQVMLRAADGSDGLIAIVEGYADTPDAFAGVHINGRFLATAELVGGADVLGDGDDVFSAGVGANWTLGQAGNDNLEAGAGDDWMLGGEGDDRLYGGDGHDLIEGGAGADWLGGGAGDDLYVIARDEGPDRVFDREGDNLIRLDGFADDSTAWGRLTEDGDLELLVRDGEGADSLVALVEDYRAAPDAMAGIEMNGRWISADTLLAGPDRADDCPPHEPPQEPPQEPPAEPPVEPPRILELEIDGDDAIAVPEASYVERSAFAFAEEAFDGEEEEADTALM